MPKTAMQEPRTYGNWRRPISPGLGRLGFGGTAVGIIGLLVVITIMMVSFIAALILAALIALALAPLTMRDKHGRNGLQWISARVGWTQVRLRGRHLYRAGPLGPIALGTHKLPGLLAAAGLTDARDVRDQPFGLVTVPVTDHHTVVLACSADGASLVDEEQIDIWVANWGQWLSQIGHEPGLVAASVTIEAAPDTGTRLRREILGNLHVDAPVLAHKVLNEVHEKYGHGAARVSTWIALTYSGAALAKHGRRGPDDIATELGLRLPGLCHSLQMTGAGPARPMTAADLTRIVHVAFDPAMAEVVDQVDAANAGILRWDDAGPTATEEAWGHYRHDSAWSVTWVMSEAPRGEVHSTVLNRLVAPHPDIPRKRVTLLYRPHDPAASAQLVERDRKDAMFLAKQAKVANARDSVAVQAADQAAREEAAGAGLVRFAMLVTATVDRADDIKLAASALDNLTASTRVLARRAYGWQGVAFAAALPLGLVLVHHPRLLRAPLARG